MGRINVGEIRDEKLRDSMREIDKYITNSNCEDCELWELCDQITDDTLCDLIAE